MYKIYIDTTDRKDKAIKLYFAEKILEERHNVSDTVTEIAKILEKHNLKPKDITIYEANPGPGSFTGIKMGLTVVNILNLVLGKKPLSDLQEPKYGAEPNIQA